MFSGRWPDGFVPEEHGWTFVPETSVDGAPCWSRWEIPFKFPAVIVRCLHDEESGAVGGYYNGPVRGLFPEQVKLGDVWAEMLRTDLNEVNTCRTS